MAKENPLSEAIPDSLNEIFSRDPLDLLDHEISLGVAELRRMRTKWDLGEKAAGKKPKEKLDTITLGDLEL